VYTVVNRTTAKVREWIVGCEFYYARVHCSERGCAPAPPKPPCFGDLECFDEHPVTLEWTVPRTAMRLSNPLLSRRIYGSATFTDYGTRRAARCMRADGGT
jgi:hypothetical protein